MGLKGKEIPLEDIVLDWAYTYANWEIYHETEEEPFNSSELDVDMMGDVYEYYGERRNDFIDQIAEDYGVDEDKYKKLKDPNLSIRDIEQIALSDKLKKGGKK